MAQHHKRDITEHVSRVFFSYTRIWNPAPPKKQNKTKTSQIKKKSYFLMHTQQKRIEKKKSWKHEIAHNS